MYEVAIRDNSTGETRLSRHLTEWVGSPDDPEGESALLFLWTDGNNACDCTRGDMFAEAGNEPAPEDGTRCGTSRFTAIYAELPDGRRIEIDDEPD